MRPLLWNEPALFSFARSAALTTNAMGDRIRNTAVILGEGETTGGLSNTHFLQVGIRRQLAEKTYADSIFIEVGRILGQTDDWPHQRVFLRQLFAGYFGFDCTNLGWVSLLTLRRPQSHRNLEDESVRIVSPVDRPDCQISPTKHQVRDRVHFNDVLLPMGAARFTISSSRREPVIRRLSFSRTVVSRYGTSPLKEWWYAPISHEGDDDVLRCRQIPALLDEGHYSRERECLLNTSILLNLVKMTPDRRVLDCTLEIHPRSGGILSIRGYDTTLPTSLIVASAIEERALSQALRALAVDHVSSEGFRDH